MWGASGMSLSGASTSVPTSAEASGADGGSPDLVWNGEAGSHEPAGKGSAPAVPSQVGGILHWSAWGLPELLACGSNFPSLGGGWFPGNHPPITLFPPATHMLSASWFILEPSLVGGASALCRRFLFTLQTLNVRKSALG